MKAKSNLDAFNELNSEIKPSQEVNNNSATALNNNTAAAAISSSNNSTTASNKNEPPVSVPAAKGDQAPITPNSSLNSNSPSASGTNQNSINNNSSTNSQSSSTNSNSSNHNYTFEYWSQLMKDSKQLQTFSNLFMHVERLLDEGNSILRRIFRVHSSCRQLFG